MDIESLSQNEYILGSGEEARIKIPFQYKERKGNWGGGVTRKKTKVKLNRLKNELERNIKNSSYKKIVNSIIQEEEGHRRKRGSFGKFPTKTIEDIKVDEEEWGEFRDVVRKIDNMSFENG